MRRTCRILAAAAALAAAASGCTTMSEPKMKPYAFPREEAFVGDVKRPYKPLGTVKTKVDYETLDWVHDEDQLCHNYYNKAVQDLVRRAKNVGADAVIKVKSVVFLEDGHVETYDTPECSDDGAGGQVLAAGVAVKWVKPPEKAQKSD